MPRTLEEEKRLAQERPIKGPYPELARELRRLLGYNGDHEFVTARMAAQRSGVNYTSISEALRGHRPNEVTLYRLAHTFGGDTGRLMRLARYPATNFPAAPPAGEGDLTDEQTLLEAFRSMTPQGRRTLLAVAAAVRSTDVGDAPPGES